MDRCFFHCKKTRFWLFRFDGFFLTTQTPEPSTFQEQDFKEVKWVLEVGRMIVEIRCSKSLCKVKEGLNSLNCICDAIPTGSLWSWSMVVATFAVFLGCHHDLGKSKLPQITQLLGGTSLAEICIRSLDVLLASQELMKSSVLRQQQYYDSMLLQWQMNDDECKWINECIFFLRLYGRLSHVRWGLAEAISVFFWGVTKTNVVVISPGISACRRAKGWIHRSSRRGSRATSVGRLLLRVSRRAVWGRTSEMQSLTGSRWVEEWMLGWKDGCWVDVNHVWIPCNFE